MSTHNLCFEQKYEKYPNSLSENFPFLAVKFSIYLNRHVFVMLGTLEICLRYGLFEPLRVNHNAMSGSKW